MFLKSFYYFPIIIALFKENVQNVALPAIIDEGYYLGFGHGTLLIKPYPAIDNYQSDLYEVYMEPYAYNSRSVSAIALIEGKGESTLRGEVSFVQRYPPAGPVIIQGNFTGLPIGKHGLHIHQSGDLRQGCEKLGEHFNPYLMRHGGSSDSLRHVGDLGNVEANGDGQAQFRLVDPIISLVGARSVIGRAIVITLGQDDLGRSGTADSITTGSSGNPLGCSVIAYVR